MSNSISPFSTLPSQKNINDSSSTRTDQTPPSFSRTEPVASALEKETFITDRKTGKRLILNSETLNKRVFEDISNIQNLAKKGDHNKALQLLEVIKKYNLDSFFEDKKINPQFINDLGSALNSKQPARESEKIIQQYILIKKS